jgi:hypothetical protein
MKTLLKSDAYVIQSRRIEGTRAEKLDQIDRSIQELLDIKLLECAADQPNLRFLAVPQRTHWVPMMVTILMMLVLLVLLLGVHPAHAQEAGAAPQQPPAAGVTVAVLVKM